MSAFNNSEAVVIDNGTGYIKAGFAGEDSPQAILPSSTNFRLKVQYGSASQLDDDNAGLNSNFESSALSSSSSGADGNGNGNNNNNRADKSPGGESFKRPIRRGTIENWDSMTTAWRYVLHHELGLDPAAVSYFSFRNWMPRKRAHEPKVGLLFLREDRTFAEDVTRTGMLLL